MKATRLPIKHKPFIVTIIVDKTGREFSDTGLSVKSLKHKGVNKEKTNRVENISMLR